MVGLYVALFFLSVLLWLLIQQRRHSAPIKYCTAETPAPADIDTQAIWHHKDLDLISEEGIHAMYRCRHCGFTLRHVDD